MTTPHPDTVRARRDAVHALAETASAPLRCDGWQAGAHGDGAQPKPAVRGDGYRFTVSRIGRAEPGAAAVADEAGAVRRACEDAGCTVEVREFGGGQAVWVVATLGDDSVVTKLVDNGNRLITAESRDFDDATVDEAIAALA